MSGRSKESDEARVTIIAQRGVASDVLEDGYYLVEIVRKKTGRTERFSAYNTVVDTGLNYKRATAFLDGTKITAWYVMPVDSLPTIANADTYALHTGWVEILAYDESARQAWSGLATGTAGEVSNAASPAAFTISTDDTVIGGVALVGGGSSPSVKNNTAGGGTLMSVAAFTGGDRTLDDGDILRVTYIQRSSRPS